MPYCSESCILPASTAAELYELGVLSACRSKHAHGQPQPYEQSSPKHRKPVHESNHSESAHPLPRAGSGAMTGGPVRNGIADKVEQAKQKLKAQGSGNLGPSSRLAAAVAGPIKAKKRKVYNGPYCSCCVFHCIPLLICMLVPSTCMQWHLHDYAALSSMQTYQWTCTAAWRPKCKSMFSKRGSFLAKEHMMQMYSFDCWLLLICRSGWSQATLMLLLHMSHPDQNSHSRYGS